MSTPTSPKVPLSQRITWQMVIVFLIPAVAIGYVAKSFFAPDIQDAGNGYKLIDNLKAMSTFAFDQQNGKLTDIPVKWRELDGKKVKIIGEMYVSRESGDQIHDFDIVYSIAKCCFSGTPQVQHFVTSKAPQGVPNYYGSLVEVSGTLHVNVVKDKDKVASIYQLDVQDVKPMS